jgi:ferredoxin
MNSNIIFCYSGTGNCLDLAKNIAYGIGGADIIMMRSEPAVTDVREAKRVGFVFPCYGGGAPDDVLKYAKMIQVDPDAYTFGISQSACYMGTGLNRLNKIIKLKYWRAVTHHCSCVWLFPHKVMLPLLSVEKAQARSEVLAAEIASDIVAGKESSRKPPKRVLNKAENKIWPALSGTRIKKFTVSDKCIACGQCADLCPRGNIRIENGRAVIGADCAQCLGCLQFCPQGAIAIGKITDKREHYHNPNVQAADLMEEIIHVE